MNQLRFSIRSLLAMVALAAVVIWWFSMPSVTAIRFTRAMNDQRYEQAAKLIIEADDEMLTEWKPIVHVSARTEKLTWRKLLSGRRNIDVTVRYQQPNGGEIEGTLRLQAGAMWIRRRH